MCKKIYAISKCIAIDLVRLMKYNIKLNIVGKNNELIDRNRIIILLYLKFRLQIPFHNKNL